MKIGIVSSNYVNKKFILSTIFVRQKGFGYGKFISQRQMFLLN